MSIPEMWEKFGPDDARAVIGILLLILCGTLWLTDHDGAANTVFAVFAGLVAQYYYAKGEN